jgi:hypothetical protein
MIYIINITLPSASVSPKLLLLFRFSKLNVVCTSHCSNACYIPCTSHPPWFDHPLTSFITREVLDTQWIRKLGISFIVVMGWDYVSVELRLLISPMSIPQIIHEWIWSSTGIILTGKIKEPREKPVLVPLCPPQTPHGQPALVANPSLRREAQWLTTWVTALPGNWISSRATFNVVVKRENSRWVVCHLKPQQVGIPLIIWDLSWNIAYTKLWSDHSTS